MNNIKILNNINYKGWFVFKDSKSKFNMIMKNWWTTTDKILRNATHLFQLSTYPNVEKHKILWDMSNGGVISMKKQKNWFFIVSTQLVFRITIKTRRRT